MMLRSLALLLVVLCPLVARAAAPANDSFAHATVLAPVNGPAITLNNQTGAGATPEALDPYINGVKPAHSVWYRFDGLYNLVRNDHLIVNHLAAANIGVFLLNDADGGAGSLSVLQQVSHAAGTDTLTFETGAGQRYYVCVDTPGAFSITLQLPGQLNYYFVDAITLTGNQGSIEGSNLNCPASGDRPTIQPPANVISGVWYAWTPTVTATMVVDTNFSYFDPATPHPTALSVFTGTSLANLTAVGGNSNMYGGARFAFAATAGTTYHIWVGSAYTFMGPAAPGPIQLEWFQEGNVGTFDILPGGSISLGDQQGTSTFSVRRRFAGNVAATVSLSTANDTAVGGTDFTAITNQPISFPAATGGPSSDGFLQNFTLTLLPRTEPPPSLEFFLNLSNPTAGGMLGNGSADITILADPTPVAPGFETTSMTIKATDGTFSIPIQRSSTVGVAGITITANVNGTDTAKPEIDYDFFYPGATMTPGQGIAFLTGNVINTNKPQGNRFFTLTITPTLSQMTVEGSSTLTVTILDPLPPQPATGRIATVLDQDGSFSGIAGSLVLNITSTGAATGKLVMDKGTFAFSGKFNASGLLTVYFGAPPTRTLTVQLLDSVAQTYLVTLVDDSLGTQVSATLTATDFSTVYPCQAAGAYTCADTGNNNAPYTAGSLKVDALGNATLTGRIFDGTAFVAAGAVDASNNLSVGVSLYAGGGRLTASAVLPATPQTLATSAILRLERPGPANQSVVLGQLQNVFDLDIALYTPPTAGSRVLSIWNPAGAGTATLDGGGFVSPAAQSISVSTANVVSLTGTSLIPSLKLTLTPSTGIFTGTVIPTGATKAVAIYGALLQGGAGNTEGLGFFLNGLGIGGVTLQ